MAFIRICVGGLIILGVTPCGAEEDGETERGLPRSGSASADATQQTVEESEAVVGGVMRDCEKCPRLVVVPAGSFMMGSPDVEEARTASESPMHLVTIAEPFAAGAYEVTLEEWDHCVAAGGCGDHRANDDGFGRGKQPVAGVSWEDAQQYVSWLSGETGLPYRLLSEAEWEYAARAGTTTPYNTGKSISTTEANFNGIWIGESRRDGPLPVGSFPGNAFGLHDVHGNVNEWVQDCWNADYEGAPVDGGAWEEGDCGRRVLRGCSYGDRPACLRSASRGGIPKTARSPALGLRVARALRPASP